jgi:hypothetical protein
MSNDPLALSGITAGPPQEAEYDAVYAAVTATARGRWFLAEYANRNRHADTGLLVAAIARIEAAIRGDAALCDALEAAVREICAVCAKSEANGEHADGVAELLRDLAGRLDNLIKVSLAGQATSQAASRVANHDANNGAGPPAKDDAIAASLNSLTDDTEPTSKLQSEPADAVVAPADYAEVFEPPAKPADATDPAPRWSIAPPDFVFHPPGQQADKAVVGASGESEQPHSLLPRMQLLVGPQDDPADLFEPAPVSLPASPAAMPAPAPSVSAAAGPPAENPPPQLRIANGPPVRAMVRPAPSDPLAAIRALSADELIALFG